uniref:Uncharacterized protein n=1 Tax=Oryza nivara TaxID=4536 RepID=A0A0E0GY21_ORYNI
MWRREASGDRFQEESRGRRRSEVIDLLLLRFVHLLVAFLACPGILVHGMAGFAVGLAAMGNKAIAQSTGCLATGFLPSRLLRLERATQALSKQGLRRRRAAEGDGRRQRVVVPRWASAVWETGIG